MAKKTRRGKVGAAMYRKIKDLQAANPLLTNRQIGKIVGINESYVSFAITSSDANEFVGKLNRHRRAVNANKISGTSPKTSPKRALRRKAVHGWVTQTVYEDMKTRITNGETYHSMGISVSTYHRIKRSADYSEYKKLIQPKGRVIEQVVEIVKPKTKTVKVWAWGHVTIKIPALRRCKYEVVEES